MKIIGKAALGFMAALLSNTLVYAEEMDTNPSPIEQERLHRISELFSVIAGRQSGVSVIEGFIVTERSNQNRCIRTSVDTVTEIVNLNRLLFNDVSVNTMQPGVQAVSLAYNRDVMPASEYESAILSQAKQFYEKSGMGPEMVEYLQMLSEIGFRGLEIRRYCDGTTDVEPLGAGNMTFFIIEGSSDEFISLLSSFTTR